MILNIIVLIVTTVLAGLSYFKVGDKKGSFFNGPLVFAGSYLFSITIVHILPELYTGTDKPFEIGMIMLAGFFLQHLLEYFSSGVEHGHIHHHDAGHSHSNSSAIALLISLCLHALLEGTLLSHPSELHGKHETQTLLFGIIIHKMPAAFALMSVMSCYFTSMSKRLVCLAVFAVMSPLGLIISNFVELNTQYFNYLFAVVSGSFLHISTTIFVETNPGHKSSLKKIGLLVGGVAAALVVEML